MSARKMALEALNRQLSWHEARKKELSKSGRSHTATGWEMLQHGEEIDALTVSIAALEADIAQPVNAQKKDSVFQASIDFIGTLTGMMPPPIEIAPAETFKPFKEFTDKICEIFASPQEPAVNAELLAALNNIRQMTDADDPESYRCDDPEGCLDTVFEEAVSAIAKATGGAA